MSLAIGFSSIARTGSYTSCPMRIRVSAARVRIADLCLVLRSQPVEQVLTILHCRYRDSLSGRSHLALCTTAADYRQMGISTYGLSILLNRVGYDCSTTAWLPVEEFRVAGSAISFRLTDLWSELEANR